MTEIKGNLITLKFNDGSAWTEVITPSLYKNNSKGKANGVILNFKNINLNRFKKVKEIKDKLIKKNMDEIILDESGEWVFWPTHNKGYYKSEYLKIIADHLDKLNNKE